MLIDVTKLLNRMTHLKHFKGLSFADLEVIIKAGHIRQINTGVIITMEEEPCAGLFVLLRGQVHLYRLGPDGQEVLMDVTKPVTMFNEVAILDGGPNTFTAIAAKDCIIWNAADKSLVDLSERYPQIALGFLPILAARQRALISIVTDVCFRSVRARTAKLLLDLSICGQQSITRQEHTIYKMSAQVSTVPEAISRSLRFFHDQGYIVNSRSLIIIRQPKELARLAQVELCEAS